jgi:hypothetical protein
MRFDVLGLAAGWVLVVFVGLLCLTFLIKVWTNEINISRVISEPNGDASLSRLQFLIFTVVISMSLFLVIMENQPQPAFPAAPTWSAKASSSPTPLESAVPPSSSPPLRPT